jgi:glycosyltransferase involved in cell wall biosynthesis
MVLAEWRVPTEKVQVIRNGICVRTDSIDQDKRAAQREQLGFGESDFVIGAVGIFRPVKDFPNLVAATAEIVRQKPQTKLALIGDGPARSDIERAVDRFGLGPAVRFLGLRPNARELLPLMDLFAQSSISEGISLSLLEAMAEGLPCVATRVGGNPEIIQEGETGFLVTHGSADEMARAILSLIEDPVRRKNMGVLGQQRVRTHFSLERMVKDYRDLYAESRN